ncbi:MAG TPA: DUF1592 domain-containing protein [Kofleriaceae bacterium]|nr:DUF1592 domain-containing protein [Kofleriaceae bacterium]
MRCVVTLLACVACTGCVGSVEGPPADPGPTCGVPAFTPFRRLTRHEYDRTVRDLLGDDSAPADAFPPEEDVRGFDNNAGALTMSDRLAEAYLGAAEALAEHAIADVDRLTGCAADTMHDACARAFIDAFGARAFRRPLDEEERAVLATVYATGAAQWDHATGIRLVLEAMLQSPQFLYRIEMGEPGGDGWSRPTPWEMASRLSYLFWGSMPDEELFAAARAGRLSTPDELEAHARRLLADPRAAEHIAHFHEQWLGVRDMGGVDKDDEVYPDFSPELVPSMQEEVRRFTVSVFTEGSGTVEELLTATYSFVDEPLAAYYGVGGVTGGGFHRVDFDPTRHAGLLTLGGVLATNALPTETSPILRGKFVQERLLCNTLPSPPDDIEIVPPDPDASLTTRERFEQHRADPLCAGCHDLMDPIGFGFEHYDGAGRWRDDENGLPIDDSGALVASDVDGAFVGPVELGRKLAGSAQVQTCVATHWFEVAHGRSATPEDACSIDQLEARLAETGGDLRELLVALVRTDAFRYRASGGAP